MKKRFAKEILIFSITIISIITVSSIWYFSTRYRSPQTQSHKEILGYRELLLNKLNHSYNKTEFEKLIELKDKETFLRTITDTSINKKIFDKLKTLETYSFNGKNYTNEQLDKKYGTKKNEAIKKFGFQKNSLITQLSYLEFNKEIQSDTISNSKRGNTLEKQILTYPRDYKSDFFTIAGLFLFIIYPLRSLFHLLNWCFKELKN